MQFDLVTSTPIGKVGVNLKDNIPVGVTLRPDIDRAKTPKQYAWLKAWFDAYFENASSWTLLQPKLHGTPYQLRVWAALCELGSGEVVTYGELAKSLKSGPRAIGQACRANPCPLIVPCHRVIAANGLGGFSGRTVGEWPTIKSWLLKHEGVDY